MIAWIQRGARCLGLDRAVAFGTMSRGWILVAGPITLVLIATRFSQEVQGYYYTFSSLLALTVFLELGLGTVIQQFASHEWAGLALDGQGRITGNPPALGRLAGLARMSLRWYAAAGLLGAVGIGLAGYLFFSRDPSPQIRWGPPWFFLCAFSGVNLVVLPAWSLLDGCNQMSETNRARFVVGVVSSVTTWVAILLGAGLWTAPVVSAAGVCTTGVLLFTRFRQYFRSLRTAAARSINWREEVWPMQWRIALSWLSGYFIFSLFTPILFRYAGPVAAGQMGMTLAVANALLSIALTWVSTKAPVFGVLIAQREYRRLDQVFATSTWRTMLVVGCGAVVTWGGIFGLWMLGHPLATRLLPPLPAGLFLAATVVTTAVSSMATYLRAHKREPYLLTSVLSGLAVGGSTLLLGSRWGATGMGAGYLAWTIVFFFPNLVILRRWRRAWHADLAHASAPES